MRRAEGLVEYSRRDFCAACAGVVAAIATGCTDDDRRAISTGGLDGTPDAAAGDPDASTALPDAGDGSGTGSGSAGTCGTGATDVGAASTYTANTPKYFSSGKFFVVKDTGGFYALTAKCTHQGVTCTVSGSLFYCHAHGAEFTFAGAVQRGPASQALKHYAMCTLANGNLGVTTSQVVAATTRLNP